MKRILLYTLLVISAFTSAKAADGDLFPYPQPPADMDRLDERCDYIVSRFWRQCDFKSAMSHTDKLRSTFGDWIGLMPYATADTVHAAIDRLLKAVEKDPRHTLTMAAMAEEFAYSDSSYIRSAEIFLPFAKAVINNKKVKAQEKAVYASKIQKIENAQAGYPVRHLEFVTPEGNKESLSNYHTQMIAVVFAGHDCSDCSLARVRLSADYNINTLIDRGLLTILYLEPGAPTNEWLQATTGYPANWISGASADAHEWFEIPTDPYILLLDARHKVLVKGFDVDGLMAAMASVRQSAGL